MIWCGIVFSIIGIEALIKYCVEKYIPFGQEQKCWKDRIIIKRYHNKGAALDSFSKYPKQLLAMTSILIGIVTYAWSVTVIKEKEYVKKIALSLLLGGAYSNFFDRMIRGYVVDYVSFSYKKIRHIVFNIADFCIFIGSLLLILFSMKQKDK